MLLPCLERLLADASAAAAPPPSRLQLLPGTAPAPPTDPLLDATQEALAQLALLRQSLAAAGTDPDRAPADRFWLPFKLALHPARPVRVRESALNALQKLIAHDLLRGSSPSSLPSPSADPSSATTTATTTTATTTAPDAASSDDPAAQSALLASLFGRRFSISALLRPDGPADASASASASAPSSADPARPPLSPLSPASPAAAPDPSSTTAPTHAAAQDSLHATAATGANHHHHRIQSPLLIDDIIATVIASASSLHAGPAEDAMQLQVLKVLLTAVTSAACEVHERSLVRVLQVCFAIHAAAQKNSANDVTARASLTQMINLVFSKMERSASLLSKALESGDAAAGPAAAGSAADAAPSAALPRSSSAADLAASTPSLQQPPSSSVPRQVPSSPLDMDADVEPLEAGLDLDSDSPKDVFLVLRFLCYMSMHSQSDAQNQSTTFNPAALAAPSATLTDEPSPMSVKSRILAMDLILSVLNNAGPTLRSDDLYVRLVRDSLCLSISRNALSTNPVLFELSLSIFLLVIRYYREKLKVEVEVLLSTVYLQILEMGNATFKQKSIVLQGLIKICENPQTLVDLYVNYDCDLVMSSVFEKILNACTKITQGRTEAPAKSSASSSFAMVGFAVGLDSKAELMREQERLLKLDGLCGLVAVIQSLVTWSQDVPQQQQQQGTPPQSQSQNLNDSFIGQAGDLRARLARTDAWHRIDSKPVSPRNADPANPANPVVVSTSSGASGVETNPHDIEQAASRKQLLRRAVRLFNQKPNRGVKFLIEVGFVTSEPDSIADFLRSTPELAKPAIGEYLGDGDAGNIKVMHAFVDAIDFAGMGFVSALRYFLQLFRLPGEAQKIDRIMEKFADRYCEGNPDIFAKADTAYTLAFSVIMLNTDQHSSQIKHRMDKSAFIKNNRGINDEGDLPDEYLGGIFDEISTNEIIMEEEHAGGKLAQMSMGWGAGDLNDRQRLDMYKKEFGLGRRHGHGGFHRKLSSLAEPKVSDLCLRGFAGSIRLACTFKLETERDAFVSSLAKLTSLGNFYNIKPKNVKAIKTLMGLAVSHGELMESSWLQIIKTVSQLERMQMIVSRGGAEYPSTLGTGGLAGGSPNVRDSRGSDARSSSERIHHDTSGMGGGANSGFVASPVTVGGSGTAEAAAAVAVATPRKISPALESLVAELQSQTSLIVIDRIFAKSVSLSATAIIHFFKAVCQVSLEEVGLDAKGMPMTSATPGPPRMYLLQKIVEIAYYNMHRIRFEWTQIWRNLQPHFNTVACHPSAHVATFAVDSLRQLGMKFLEREELGHFSSQHEFLKSFEWIMKHNTSPAIRELILSSLSQMISARARSIRSGWKSIFVVLVRAAQTDERMAKTSFTTVQMVFKLYFDDVVSTGGFVDLVSCLAEFALLKGQGPAHDELVMGSIQMLQSCTKSLVERAKDEASVSASALAGGAGGKSRSKRSSAHPPTGTPAGSGRDDSIGRTRTCRQWRRRWQPYLTIHGCVSEEHFYLSWFPILSAFSRVIIESDGVLVRTHTMETLFETFRSSGHLLDSSYWKTIHRNIISPIFEDLSDPADEMAQREANSAVLILGLRLLGDMLSLHLDMLVYGTEGRHVAAEGGDGGDDGGEGETVTQTRRTVDPAGLEFLQHSLDRMLLLMGKKDDKLAATAQICFQQFLLNNVHKLARHASWSWLIDKIEGAFRATLPVELLNCTFAPRASATTAVSDAPPADPTCLSRIVPMAEIMAAAKAAAREVGEPLSLNDLDFEHTISIGARVLSGRRVGGSGRVARVAPWSPTSPSEQGHGQGAAVAAGGGGQIQPAKSFAIGVMGAADRARLLRCIYTSYALARSFNSLTELRHAIFQRGWVSQMPNLVKQETVSFSTYIVLLFGAYKTIGDGDGDGVADGVADGGVGAEAAAAGLPRTAVVEALVAETMDLLERYVGFLADPQKNARDIALWSPVVVVVFKELLTFDGWWLSGRSTGLPPLVPIPVSAQASVQGSVSAQGSVPVSAAPADPARPTAMLRRHLPRYFRLAIRMMSVDRFEVRGVLQEFMERVGDELVRVDQ
ncbi:hypothetical protein BC831DRAFT_436660 [Entophlyctis helioformis]|nr:hypothetical protein BC831DRAFT_436660 [Entophlyctis helioformis]